MQVKSRGISLIELLLSLAIIAILLVMATRFYESTRSSQQVNDATNVLQHLMAASDKWFSVYKSYQKTDNGDISLPQLITLGWLPKNFVFANANPWGGSINITPEDSTHVKFMLAHVPAKDCLNMQELLQQQLNLAGTCDTEGNYSAIYSSAGNTSNNGSTINK